jgi:indolepyruvate ferredoxin oxidoreductase
MYFNALELAVEQLGGEQYANTIVLGAAFQSGALPLKVEAIRRAIELNGVEVDANLQAFDLGRAQLLAATLGSAPTGDEPKPSASGVLPVSDAATALVLAATGLRQTDPAYDTVAQRVTELIAYQNESYARRYLADVERVRAAEAPLAATLSLTARVARSLFTLMAYKDEYEVARLHLLPELRAEIADEFGPDARISYQLHPPLLRALGLKRKVSLGPWFTPALRVLYAARRLRGTVLDPFGATTVRRAERRLVEEYRELLQQLLRDLTAESLDRAVNIAGLVCMVRGYEQIKLDNIARYRAALAEAIAPVAAPLDAATP